MHNAAGDEGVLVPARCMLDRWRMALGLWPCSTGTPLARSTPSPTSQFTGRALVGIHSCRMAWPHIAQQLRWNKCEHLGPFQLAALTVGLWNWLGKPGMTREQKRQTCK